MERVQAWLKLNTTLGQQLTEVSGHAGGNRCMEIDVWMGGINFLPDAAFREFFAGLDWDQPNRAVLLILDADGDILQEEAGQQVRQIYIRHQDGMFQVRQGLDSMNIAGVGWKTAGMGKSFGTWHPLDEFLTRRPEMSEIVGCLLKEASKYWPVKVPSIEAYHEWRTNSQ